MPSYTLAELAQKIGAEIKGDPSTVVTSIATIQSAREQQITFLDNTKYQKFLSTTKASAVVLRPEFADECPCDALLSQNPYYAYAQIAKLFDTQPVSAAGIHPSAVVAETADIHPSASIGPHCVIGESVQIGANVIIGAGCHISDNSQVGSDTRLHANVTVYHDIIIGMRCLIHSGVVLGADGFGIANSGQGAWHRVPQLGGIRIGDDVDIGANTSIDRGAIEDTLIEQGVKIDNQVQIGHNVKIGAHTAIAGCAAIAGSAVIGKHCLVGGGAGITGHITIADHVFISAYTGVSHSINEPGLYSGALSAVPAKNWRRNAVRFRNLDESIQKLNRLEKIVMNAKKSEDVT